MKKALALILALTMVLVYCSGCTTQSSSPTAAATVAQSATAQATATATPAPTPTPTPTAAPPKSVTLKVFMGSPRFKDQFDAYFKQFATKEKAEKNIDVTVNLEMPNPDQARQILEARLASNDAPDVFDLNAIANIPTYYKAGYLTDLSDQPFVGTLYDNVKKIVTYDGKVVALPLESLAWGYLYNKKMFSDLGLTPPMTIDDMNAVVAKLKANKITPFLLTFQESWIPQLMMALSLGGTVSSAHPDWVDKMNQGTASYKDVESVFDIIDVIMQNGTSKPFEVGSAAGCADFANGKAAMWVQGPWEADAILKVNPDMQFGVAPLPVSNDPKGAMINLAVSTSLAVCSMSKNKDTAIDLVDYVLDPNDSSALYQELKFNPVANFMKYSNYAWTDEAMTYVANGQAYTDLTLPNGVTDETAKQLQSYYAKQVTKDGIIKALDAAWAKGVKASN